MDVGERLTRVGTGAHLWPVQAVVWQKPTQHGKAIFFQLKILKSKAVCCPVLANPLLEKQERLAAWHPCGGDSVPSPPSRATITSFSEALLPMVMSHERLSPPLSRTTSLRVRPVPMVILSIVINNPIVSFCFDFKSQLAAAARELEKKMPHTARMTQMIRDAR